jgi:hypothetical protein
MALLTLFFRETKRRTQSALFSFSQPAPQKIQIKSHSSQLGIIGFSLAAALSRNAREMTKSGRLKIINDAN